MNQSKRIKTGFLSPKRYTLLTGATGLLGRYLLRDLLVKGVRMAVLVRPKARSKARQRIEDILQMWESELGQRLPRPVLLTGDVCEPNLGLQPGQVQWVGRCCDQIIHSAAVLSFHGASRASEPWRTNLGGTRNVLAFAKQCDISKLHHVSTAYVCGEQDQLVSENQLDVGQEFRNDYEQSKFEAEQLVHQADGFESKTIYRPAVIVGDSETGYTSTYHGLFLYLRLMAMLVPHQQRDENGIINTPIKLPYNGDEPRNLVPIDWASRAIAHLVCTPEAHGQTYHLTPDQCTCPREVIESCYEYFHSDGVEFCGPDAACPPETEFAQKLFESTGIYASYETSDPVFDKSNLNKFAGHLPCPPIDRDMIFKFLDFGDQQNWGKKKQRSAVVPRWIESHLTEIALAAQKIMGALRLNSQQREFQIGLDIHGPGGGQWQLTVEDGSFRITPGLPDESCPVLKLNDLQINELLLHSSESQTLTNEAETIIDWTSPLETLIRPD